MKFSGILNDLFWIEIHEISKAMPYSLKKSEIFYYKMFIIKLENDNSFNILIVENCINPKIAQFMESKLEWPISTF